MVAVYIVTENETNLQWLETLLPSDLVAQVTLINAQDPSYAEGMAASVASARRTPVALVVNPDPSDPITNEERAHFWQNQMRRTGMEGLVIVAEPDVPTALTPDAPLTRKLFAFIEQALLQVR